VVLGRRTPDTAQAGSEFGRFGSGVHSSRRCSGCRERWESGRAGRWLCAHARHIQWAFEAYSTGEYSIRSLTEELAARGVGSGWGSRRGKPLANSYVHRLLTNRYYLGYVTFQGTEYPGRHQPLISQSLFDRVQEVLAAHDRAGERQRVHAHYLKGSIFCGQCGSRLAFTLAKGIYPYFFCLGRQKHRTACQQPNLQVEAVETAVEKYYRSVRIPAGLKGSIQDGLRAELDSQHERSEPEIACARQRVTELDRERRRLATGVVKGSIPGDLARDEHERIDAELEQAQRILETAEMIYARIEQTLTRALDLLERVDEVYRLGGPRVRRLLNQCFFVRLLIDGEGVVGAVLREPWATLLAEDFQARMIYNISNPDHDRFGQGSSMKTLVRSSRLDVTWSFVA
jgi:site-specific DNA recombinase